MQISWNSGQVFGLILSFLSNKRLQVVLDEKPSQEHPVNTGALRGSFIGSTLFLLCIGDLTDDVICNIAMEAADALLYPNCDEASDSWQQQELTSEPESDLHKNEDWGSKWLVHLNTEKTQLVPFYRSNNTGAKDVKKDGPVLKEKSSFKMLGLSFSSKLDLDSYVL